MISTAQRFSLPSWLGKDHLAVDTETEGVAFWDPAFCVTFSWYEEGELLSQYLELSDENDWAYAHNLLSRDKILVFHNAKFDLQKLILAGLLRREAIHYERIHDTEGMAHLLDEHQRKGLKPLARSILGEETDEEEAIRAAFRKAKLRKDDGYHRLPREVIIPYALKDTEYTLRLFAQFWPLIQRWPELTDLYETEMKLCLVLLDMEARGMKLDMEYLERTAKEYALRILHTELQIKDIAGEEFNPNSPAQIKAYFEDIGVYVDSTSKDALAEVDHPLAALILSLRSDSKMHGTYLKALLNEQRDGIVHPWFRQYRAKTGRMASGGASN